MIKKAIIVETDSNFECRCANCGKLLFTISKNFSPDVDKTTQNVRIVARCTRNSCKTNNLVYL